MGIEERLGKFLEELGAAKCTLIAVSKTKPVEDILEAYNTGHRDFGENKVQDLADKYEVLPKDIRWHMIGHLQRNKVKYIAPFVHLIHGVDSEKLLREINKQGEKNNRIIPCLLQVHIAEESTKFGFDVNEVLQFLKSGSVVDMKFVKVKGLMGMATFTDDIDQVRREFRSLKKLYDRIESEFEIPNVEMSVLSMGMSGDYTIALEEGSTMIRIGTAIFGER